MKDSKVIPSTSTRRDISIVLSKTHNIPQSLAYKIIDTTFEALMMNLFENGHLELRGVGVFEIVEHKGRKGRNPKRPTEEVWIPSRKSVKFRVSKLLRKDLAAAKAHVSRNVPDADKSEEV